LRANVVESGGTKRLEFATSDGFMQALPDRLIVLVDQAVSRDQVDLNAAHSELESAQGRQKTLAPQTAEYALEQSAIDFANAKLALAH
jgi:F0F1-type ATP synthase epsilon subunit